MSKKIKVAFIYRDSNIFLSGKHFDNVYYHFFMDALSRNPNLEITNFPTRKKFDASILKNRFEGNNKLIWTLVVLFTWIIGSLLYFLIGRKQKIQSSAIN